MNQILFIMGPSCSGKSSLVAAMSARLFEENISTHVVSIGKQLREKYPLEHFQGMGAPPHVEEEALEMLHTGIRTGQEAGAQIILVDGQPRSWDQAEHVLHTYLTGAWEASFVVLTQPVSVLFGRAAERATSSEECDFYVERIKNDRAQLFDTVSLLQGDGIEPLFVRTEDYDSDQMAQSLIQFFVKENQNVSR